MRAWFWTLLVFVAAVALALLLRDHSGNVLVLVQPWRIELSLTFAVLLLLAIFIALHVLLRFLSWVTGSPERFRSWRGLRAQRRDHNLLEHGWVHLLEGRYEQADKDLTRLLGKTRSHTSKVVAALACARAAHRMGERARRDELLSTARTNARDNLRLKEAVAVVEAEIYLDDGHAPEALMLLQPLQDASSRYFHTTRLLLRAYQQMGDGDRVYELTRLLVRRSAIDPSDARRYIALSGAARLKAAGIDGWKAVWNDLKADEKTIPSIALTAANVQTEAGNDAEAARILEAAISATMDPQLLAAYAQCPAHQVGRRLGRAEVWAKNHPDDASLLAALGSLCIIGELWGQAERYLLQSMRIRSDMRIHALLGNLYDGLGRPAEAAKHWRLASDVAGKLPVLAITRALPAADTQLDPALFELDRQLLVDHAVSENTVPVAASAADTFSDDSFPDTPTDRLDMPESSTISSASSDVDDLDEYFDSAPIPGVDMTKISDDVRSRTNKS